MLEAMERDEIQRISLARAALSPEHSLEVLERRCGNDFDFARTKRPRATEHWTQPQGRGQYVIFATPKRRNSTDVVYIPLDELRQLYVGIPLSDKHTIEQTVHDALFRPAPRVFGKLARAFAEFLGGTVTTNASYAPTHDDAYLTPILRTLAALEPYKTPLPLCNYVRVSNKADRSLKTALTQGLEIRL